MGRVRGVRVSNEAKVSSLARLAEAMPSMPSPLSYFRDSATLRSFQTLNQPQF